MEAYLGTVLMRTLHILFGILWIGLLYYFNFVQTEYFKESEADAKSDVVKNLFQMLFGTSDGLQHLLFSPGCICCIGKALQPMSVLL